MDTHLEFSCPDCGGDRDYPGLCDACSRPRLSLREQADALMSRYANRLVTTDLLEQIQTAMVQWLERILAERGSETTPRRPQVSISVRDGRVDIYLSRRSDTEHLRRAGIDMVGFARLHDLRIEVPDNDHRLLGWLLFRT